MNIIINNKGEIDMNKVVEKMKAQKLPIYYVFDEKKLVIYNVVSDMILGSSFQSNEMFTNVSLISSPYSEGELALLLIPINYATGEPYYYISAGNATEEVLSMAIEAKKNQIFKIKALFENPKAVVEWIVLNKNYKKMYQSSIFKLSEERALLLRELSAV